MRISDCIRINNCQYLKIIVTMLSCYNGKVVSLQNDNETIWFMALKNGDAKNGDGSELSKIDIWTIFNIKQYTKAFDGDERTIIKIGINFSSDTRRLTEWKIGWYQVIRECIT